MLIIYIYKQDDFSDYQRLLFLQLPLVFLPLGAGSDALGGSRNLAKQVSNGCLPHHCLSCWRKGNMFSPQVPVKSNQIKSKCADYNTLLRGMKNVSTIANRSGFSKILIPSLQLTALP